MPFWYVANKHTYVVLSTETKEDALAEASEGIFSVEEIREATPEEVDDYFDTGPVSK